MLGSLVAGMFQISLLSRRVPQPNLEAVGEHCLSAQRELHSRQVWRGTEETPTGRRGRVLPRHG